MWILFGFSNKNYLRYTWLWFLLKYQDQPYGIFASIPYGRTSRENESLAGKDIEMSGWRERCGALTQEVCMSWIRCERFLWRSEGK